MDHSKLYHYISAFEADTKRKIAMETRRVDMLEPLLDMLSKSAYEGLHKSVRTSRVLLPTCVIAVYSAIRSHTSLVKLIYIFWIVN
jgi:hypothetical protein